MKKVKLLAPILASVATVAPLTTTLANCSCSNIDYTKLTKTFKEDALKYFSILSKKFRPTWGCGEAYEYIKATMESLGFSEVGHDDWSAQAASEGKTITGPAYGNIWYDIPASEGCETWPKIIFSAYYDMPYDCDDATLEEIKTTGIPLHIDEDTQVMYSENSKCACGFNDGLGIASMLAFAKNENTFAHGPVRLLFTADSGDSTTEYASGAAYLSKAQKERSGGLRPIDTPYIINSDGNSQAEINVSSAGIHQCTLHKDYTETGEHGDIETVAAADFTAQSGESNPKKLMFTIKVSGLTGGHSATNINDGVANATKILFEYLTTENTGMRIRDASSSHAGGAGYNIPTEASATFVIDYVDGWKNIMEQKKQSLIDGFENSYPADKGKIKIEISDPIIPETDFTTISHERSLDICCFVNICKYGPCVWFDPEYKEVKTSANICPFLITPIDNGIRLSGRITCRSANAVQLKIYSNYTHVYLKKFLDVSEEGTTGDYEDYDTPVWENSEDLYKTENKMSNLMMDAYKRFRYTPKEVNCHGWLEAACFVSLIQTLPEGQNIPFIATIGPTIVSPQTKDEKLYISTLNSCIRVLIYCLHNAQALTNK